MMTKVLRADSGAIAEAAAILRAGGLVAFPTETVYGLGANAMDVKAVASIFAAKGRPSHNPIIVHVSALSEAVALAEVWPERAQQLVERFWPGPLTLVVSSSPRIPSLVTAGGPTVALRVPAHPVAQALLKAVGLPVAAPSANRSSQLSPTRAEHVRASLDGRIPLVLDAGPTSGGLESTVLDVSVQPARLLRPGLVTPGQIEAVIGPIVIAAAESQSTPLRSPGMAGRHYAPRTPLEVVAGDGRQRVQRLIEDGRCVGWLTLGEPPKALQPHQVVALAMPVDPASYAAELYTALHALDVAGLDRIVVACPPSGEEWLAVQDRLRRASLDA